MKTFLNRRGVTMIEMVAVVAILAVIVAIFAMLLGKNTTMYKRMQVRQTVMIQSRTAMDMMQQRLRNGKARSMVISTPDETPIVPNSRIDFVLQAPLPSGATAYALYLSSRTAYAVEYPNGLSPKVLARNVSGLMFTGDALDPSVVGITLRIDAPYDATGHPDHTSTIILPNQKVHMVETP
jgi:prepilin-type N-terminal cleavage/methylation domain-containing protein